MRDLTTHKPLEGVDAGDIGPKYGYSTKDNGFLYLRHVRIPRKNLLSKFTSVTEEGKVVIQGNPKFSYATMMFIRVGLIFGSGYAIASPLAIAMRYGL